MSSRFWPYSPLGWGMILSVPPNFKKTGVTMKEHIEIIKCPKCGLKQPATVKHTKPKFSYVHECTRCFYIIDEKDWETIEFTKKRGNHESKRSYL